MQKNKETVNNSDSSDDDDIYDLYNSKNVCNRFKSQIEQLKSTLMKPSNGTNVQNNTQKKKDKIPSPPKKKASPKRLVVSDDDNDISSTTKEVVNKKAEESNSSSDDSVQSLGEINVEDCIDTSKKKKQTTRRKSACNDAAEFVSEEPPARSTRSRAGLVASRETAPVNSPVKKKKRGTIDNYFKPVNNDVVEILDEEEDEDEIIELEDEDKESEDEEDEVNFEVGVKIVWKSIYPPKRFTLRKFQKFSTIFDHFMKEEKVTADKIILTLNGQKIKPTDTPESFNLKAYHFIEGGLLTKFSNNYGSTNAEEDVDEDDENMVSVKFQDKNKKIVKLKLKKTDKIKIVMMKYSEQMEIPMEKIKFLFDGEILDPAETPVTLGLENEEIIDVKYL